MSKSYLFFYGIFLWSLPENDGGGGALAVKGDERVIAYEKKKKERSKWVAGQESKDTCEMCGLGEWGRWGHTCGSLKYLTPPPPFFLYSWIELGCYKRCRVGFCGWGKTKGKEKKKK